MKGKETCRSIVPKSQLVTIRHCVQRHEEKNPYGRIVSVHWIRGTNEALYDRLDTSVAKAPSSWN